MRRIGKLHLCAPAGMNYNMRGIFITEWLGQNIYPVLHRRNLVHPNRNGFDKFPMRICIN